ncbi:acyl-CoA desaturase [Sigmodon hispidus]
MRAFENTVMTMSSMLTLLLGWVTHQDDNPYIFITQLSSRTQGLLPSMLCAQGSPTSFEELSESCEGFHNYHHVFPYDYSASEYHWHINFTTFFIDCMAALGLAYDRKKVSKAAVLTRIKRTRDGSYKS